MHRPSNQKKSLDARKAIKAKSNSKRTYFTATEAFSLST